MNLPILNNEEDSDSDFDPLTDPTSQLNLNPNPSNTNPSNARKLHKHRYQTRSSSMLSTTNSTSNTDNTPSIDISDDTNTKRRGKKRGRPKGKRRKKKSNHIDTSKHRNNANSDAKKERLSKMDKYDTQQYIDSVTNAINNGTYSHPFLDKPTSLPKRRIAKIMRLDPVSFKISSMCVELMAILIEIFIRDIVSRSYKYTIKDNRKSLQLQDVCRAVQSDHLYDFLIDIVPRIQSYDEESNVYNFIYTHQMQNCLLTNDKRRVNVSEEQKESVENECEDSENENIVTSVRRSRRIRAKKSDKEEAD